MARNFVWYSVGSTIYMGGMWIITYLVMIISGPTSTGILGLAIASTNVFFTVSVWGMRAYQVSDLHGKFSDSTYITSRILTCVVSMLACIIFVFFKGFTFEEGICILLYMVFKISEAFVDVYNGIAQRHWRLDIIGKSNIARAVLTVSSFCLMLYFTKSLALAIIAMIVCSYLFILSYDILQTVKIAQIKNKFDVRSTFPLLVTCAPLIVCAFLYSFNVMFTRLLLKDAYGTDIFGYYSAIASPVLVIHLLASFIYSPLIPLFSKSHTERNTKAFARLLIKTILIISALSVVAIVGCYFFGDWGLSILYSSKPGVLDYSYLLVPTVLTVICTVFIWLLNNVMTAIRQIKFLFFSTIVGSVVCVAISGNCIDVYGVNGINVSLIILQMVQILLLISYLIWYVLKGLAEGKSVESAK